MALVKRRFGFLYPALILPLSGLLVSCQQGTASKNSQPTRWEEPAPARTVAAGGGGTTATGLQYEVLRAGSGRKPTRQDTVKVHYHGTLLNGTVFDSSVQRGQPAVFGLTQVIPGWTEGLQLMPVGSKFRFRIPPHLGYGERGSPPKIGPNETLVFEVELLEIVGG
ncbi:MAG: FKBP-type peptidyl-prolyl cis-trans isomerase [Verrucomicrobia bacterium]|nr:FKBP-type peptidyl-prolyl cis-trans isomerase [Verrucomicrobiota bacterium]